MFEKTHNFPVKYQRCKTAWYFNGIEIKKQKIYGHWYRKKDDFRILIEKEIFGITHKAKTKKVWSYAKPSDYETDLNFIINVAINKKKDQLEQRIKSLKQWINDLPNLIKDKENFIKQLEEAKKNVSKENFYWHDHSRKIVEQLEDHNKVSSLNINNKYEKLSYLSFS